MRIVTRPDFDGIVCAVLLYDVEPIDRPVKWIQPSEVQKGRADIRKGDIVANLPYDDRCSMWFDHHVSNRIDRPFEGSFKIAPSAAGVIFDHYRGRFVNDYSEVVAAADKIDAADLSMNEVLHPEDHPYILLSMTISDHDPSAETYWNKLVDLLRRSNVRDILRDEDVRQQCRRVVGQNMEYGDLLKKYTVLNGPVAVTDFRPLGRAPEGNRFLAYSMFPEAAVSVKIRYAGEEKEITRISVGHSIFNRVCRVNVGRMLSEFEGGGHRAAGGCSFASDKAGDYIPRMLDILLKNEPDP